MMMVMMMGRKTSFAQCDYVNAVTTCPLRLTDITLYSQLQVWLTGNATINKQLVTYSDFFYPWCSGAMWELSEIRNEKTYC